MFGNFLKRAVSTAAGGLVAGGLTAIGQPHLAPVFSPIAANLAGNLASKGISILANHKFSFGNKKYSPRDIMRKANKTVQKVEQITGNDLMSSKLKQLSLEPEPENIVVDKSWMDDPSFVKEVYYVEPDIDPNSEDFRRILNGLYTNAIGEGFIKSYEDAYNQMENKENAKSYWDAAQLYKKLGYNKFIALYGIENTD